MPKRRQLQKETPAYGRLLRAAQELLRDPRLARLTAL